MRLARFYTPASPSGRTTSEAADRSTSITLAVAMVACTLLGFGAWHMLQQQREAAGRIDHTLEVLNFTGHLRSNLVSSMAEARSVQTEHDESSRGRMTTDAGRVGDDLSALRRLTTDNSVQQHTLDQLEPLVRERLRVLQAASANPVPPAGLARHMPGMTGLWGGTEEISILIFELGQEERRLLQIRTHAAGVAAHRTALAVILCCGVAAAAVTAALLLTQARRRERVRSDRLRHYQATVELGAFMARAWDGTIQHWSKGCERLYGWTAAEAVGRISHDLLHTVFPIPLAEVEAILARDGIWEGDLRHRARDGAELIVLSRKALRCNAAGRPIAIMESVADITDQRRAEAERAESEARFRASADAIPGFLFVTDAAGGVRYVNEAFCAFTGYEAPTLWGEGWLNTLHPEDRACGRALWQESLQIGGPFEAELRVRRHDGQWRWHQMRGLPHVDESGAVRLWAGIAADIDDRKALESELLTLNQQLEQRVEARTAELTASNAALDRLARHLARARDGAQAANAAKSRFLASMSHELRTPLNGILGYAQLLRLDGKLDAQQGSRVEAMLGAGQHLLDMINRVLTLSEIEAGRAALHAEPIDLGAMARACLDLIRPDADAKGFTLRLIAPSTIAGLRTDASRVKQVLLNLLGNAVKYAGSGTIALRIVPPVDGVVRIEVADEGPGIQATKRHRLFQDFERLDADRVQVEGAGLGLALSARIATLLGGRLLHEDNTPRGSIFALELPATEGAQASPGVAERMPDAASQPPRLRVLVVDDVAMNRDIASAFLASAAHDAVCAASGEEAVEQAASADYDAILMDVCMPGMDGLEATRRIRALPGRRGRVPIVALTAQAFTEQIAECRRAGMSMHLSKPFTPEALSQAILGAAQGQTQAAA